MKPISYLVILIWSILTSQSYSMQEARDAKSFTAFNPFPLYQNSIDSYGAQIHGDPLIDSLIRHSSYPSQGGYENLERTIAKLQHKISEIKSQRLVCNSLMPAGSKVIGSVCYYVEPTPATYDVALAKCRSYGGTLVEPLPPFSISLWNALVKNFRSQMATITQFWIGASTAIDTFMLLWATTGTQVYPNPMFSSSVGGNPLFAQGVFMDTPGYPWNVADVGDSKSYVCSSSPLKASGRSYGHSKPYEFYEKTYP